jgi:predicted phage tail protein
MTSTLRTIHLHGEMLSRFGGPYRLAVASPVDVCRALGAQLAGFRRYIAEHDFRIIRISGPTTAVVGPEEVDLSLGRATDLHIVPVVAGSGGRAGNIGKIVGGVLLAATAWWAAPAAVAGGMGATAFAGISYGQIAGFGMLVALTGVSGLLTQTAKKQRSQASALFSGAQNTADEGATIPWVWGRCRVGGVIVSSGISSEEIAVTA